MSRHTYKLQSYFSAGEEDDLSYFDSTQYAHETYKLGRDINTDCIAVESALDYIGLLDRFSTKFNQLSSKNAIISQNTLRMYVIGVESIYHKLGIVKQNPLVSLESNAGNTFTNRQMQIAAESLGETIMKALKAVLKFIVLMLNKIGDYMIKAGTFFKNLGNRLDKRTGSNPQQTADTPASPASVVEQAEEKKKPSEEIIKKEPPPEGHAWLSSELSKLIGPLIEKDRVVDYNTIKRILYTVELELKSAFDFIGCLIEIQKYTCSKIEHVDIDDSIKRVLYNIVRKLQDDIRDLGINKRLLARYEDFVIMGITVKQIQEDYPVLIKTNWMESKPDDTYGILIKLGDSDQVDKDVLKEVYKKLESLSDYSSQLKDITASLNEFSNKLTDAASNGLNFNALVFKDIESYIKSIHSVNTFIVTLIEIMMKVAANACRAIDLYNVESR
jgi:hypothetical protein